MHAATWRPAGLSEQDALQQGENFGQEIRAAAKAQLVRPHPGWACSLYFIHLSRAR
jgi:hypothetical protein